MNIKKYKNYLFLLPFLFLFLILLDWHYSIGLSADDLFFYTIPQESDILSFVTERYDIWSSRTLIEYVLCHILQLPPYTLVVFRQFNFHVYWHINF